MLSHTHRAGFVEPCLPSPADHPPSGSSWIHEIKHDGYRLMARRDLVGIRLITRRGNDWSDRFPLVIEAVNHLKVRSCLIDGEVVCCDERGLARFDVLRRRRNEAMAFLYAFDLLELDGQDLRREPIEVRKATLASILRKARHGVRLNEHLAHDCGMTVFRHACKMGLEGIMSKRLGSRYRSCRSSDWLKFKNPEAPAVKREAEEDWGRRVAVTGATPRPHRWPPTWFTDLLAMNRGGGAAVFVIEAWVGKRWRPIAQSDYEASARRLFNQASYTFPVETLLRLRRGSNVLIKMPADGRGNMRE